jgi:O-antigen/teichoic acid export membrane protein
LAPDRPSEPAPNAGSRDADAAHAAKGGLVQLLGMIAQGLMPVYQVMVARLYGKAALGLYAAAIAVTEVLVRFGMAGVDKSMHRFIAAHRGAGDADLERRAFGTGVRLTVGVSAALTLGMLAFSGPIARHFHREAILTPLRLTAPAVLVAPLMYVLVAATLGRKVTRVSLFVRGLAEPGFLIVSALVAWFFVPTATGLGAAHGLAYVATALAAVLGARAVFGMKWIAAALRSPKHPELVRFALPISGSEAANAVLQRTDILVLGLFVKEEIVAVYFTAEVIARIAANVRYAFDGISNPVLAEALALKDRARLRYNLVLITRWVTTLSIPLATTTIALRNDLLGIYGTGYEIAAPVLVMHTLLHLATGILGVTAGAVNMSGRSRLNFANQSAAAIANVVLCLLLVPRYGMMGAAVAVCLSLSILLVASVVEIAVLERVHAFDWNTLKAFTAGAAAVAAQLAVAAAIAPQALRVAAVVVVGLVVYLAALAALGLAPEERALVAKLRRGKRAG